MLLGGFFVNAYAERHRRRRLELYPQLEDEEWLRQAYEGENRTLQNMADQMTMVAEALRRKGIRVRTPEESRILRGSISGKRPTTRRCTTANGCTTSISQKAGRPRISPKKLAARQ